MAFTWNVGNEAPRSREIGEWLPERGEGLDIIIIATQENKYMAKESISLSKRGSVKTVSKSKIRASITALQQTTIEDPDSDEEAEKPATDVVTTAKQKFRRRPWLWRALTAGSGLNGAGVGNANWATMLCCGSKYANMVFGRSEHLEHWERLVLQRLNSPTPEPPALAPAAAEDSSGSGKQRRGAPKTWRICKHAVLAEMRLTIYERCQPEATSGESLASTPAKRSPGKRRGSGAPFGSDVVRRLSLGLIDFPGGAARGVTLAHRDRVPLGKGGVVGNKGGLAVELHVDGTRLLVVASHLAAHDQGVHKRHKQSVAILHELMSRGKLGLAREHGGFESKMDVTSEFDHILWLGDLNYRIDLGLAKVPRALDDLGATPPPPLADVLAAEAEAVAWAPEHAYYVDKERLVSSAAKVKALVHDKDWAALEAADQLRHAQRCGHAFVAFRESPLAFAPTFKVRRTIATPLSDSYISPKEPSKMRVPSYCDRILHRSMPHLPMHLQLVRTWPVFGVSTSDHKPVCALLNLTPSPAAPPRSIQPVTLTFSRVSLIGEPQASPLLPRAHRAKIRFFASPPGILVPPSLGPRHSTAGLAGHAGVLAGDMARRMRARSSTHGAIPANANLRSQLKKLTSATTDVLEREVLTWDAADMPALTLCCGVEELDRVTLTMSVYTYTRAATKGGKSKLRGSVQLRLGPIDPQTGHIVLTPLTPSLPAGCAAPHAPAGQPSTKQPADSGPHSPHEHGPFRMDYCASLQPFALALSVQANVYDATKRQEHDSAWTNLRGLPFRVKLFGNNGQPPRFKPPPSLAQSRYESDPGDVRLHRFASAYEDTRQTSGIALELQGSSASSDVFRAVDDDDSSLSATGSKSTSTKRRNTMS